MRKPEEEVYRSSVEVTEAHNIIIRALVENNIRGSVGMAALLSCLAQGLDILGVERKYIHAVAVSVNAAIGSMPALKNKT